MEADLKYLDQLDDYIGLADRDPLLHRAIENDMDAIVEYWLQTGGKSPKLGNDRRSFDINTKSLSEGESALHLAIRKGKTNLVRMILKAGADINLQGSNENTPLHMAVEQGDLEIVNLLLDFRANPNIKNYQSYTPLMISDDYRIIKSLLEAGADPNIEDDCGRTAIFFLGAQGPIQLLLGVGIDINHKDHYGDTALHEAVDYADTFLSLLECGADPYIRNNESQTPRDLAIEKGYNYIIELLDSYNIIKEPDVS